MQRLRRADGPEGVRAPHRPAGLWRLCRGRACRPCPEGRSGPSRAGPRRPPPWPLPRALRARDPAPVQPGGAGGQRPGRHSPRNLPAAARGDGGRADRMAQTRRRSRRQSERPALPAQLRARTADRTEQHALGTGRLRRVRPDMDRAAVADLPCGDRPPGGRPAPRPARLQQHSAETLQASARPAARGPGRSDPHRGDGERPRSLRLGKARPRRSRRTSCGRSSCWPRCGWPGVSARARRSPGPSPGRAHQLADHRGGSARRGGRTGAAAPVRRPRGPACRPPRHASGGLRDRGCRAPERA